MMKRIRLLILIMLVAITSTGLAACSGGSSSSSTKDTLADRELSDMSGYEGLEEYDKDTVFVDMTVKEMDEMMKNGETFVVFFSFENCPYCNRLIPYLNDAALEAGRRVAYINTRANPEWENNMDIDDYDIVEERFAKWLPEDDDGREHLYVPDVYFIKNGKVVARHDGVTPGADDPSNKLTSEQLEQLKIDLADEFNSLN